MDDRFLSITFVIPKPNRRWFQFSLLTLLLASLLAGTWLGFVGNVFSRSRGQDRSNIQAMRLAKQRELAAGIRSMNGIQHASVDISTKRGKATGAVTVNVTRDSDSLDPAQTASIRHYVAASIAGISTEDVSVLDLASKE